ncbi:uncharacterized protein LOC116211485 isoform X2 [Punica granatum]|uniref:Uncharacterized protein LOC116211485 isoform X2 n=1 Tax=Punica granatum TaxID=22663 RepID=A0A6P8DWB6_PUNGR|nr:uncharacterized protein LOC116211485 isoform X2 [Punica granatum]
MGIAKRTYFPVRFSALCSSYCFCVWIIKDAALQKKALLPGRNAYTVGAHRTSMPSSAIFWFVKCVELYGKKEDGVFPCRIMKTRNLPPSNLVLIIETHSTLLWLLIKDDGEYSSYVQGKRRKSKGHYGPIEAHAKLEILRMLVNHALETDLVRELLDEYIEQWHELAATRRGEALQEAKKEREVKAQSDSDTAINENSLNDVDKGGLDNYDVKQSSEIALKKNNHVSKKSVSNRANSASKNNARLQKGDAAVRGSSIQHSHNKGSHQMVLKQGTNERKVSIRSKEQRKQHYERVMEKRLYIPILWGETDTTTAIGGFGVMEGYLLRVQITSCGDITIQRKSLIC